MAVERLIRVVIVGGLVALGACSGGMGDLQERIDEVKARKGGYIEPLPQIPPPPSFVYEAQDLRGPFTPHVPSGAGAGGGLRPDEGRSKEFLERFPLDTMDMVGSMSLQGRLYGLVQDPDGLVHRVLPGNYIGQSDGRVTTISDSEISILEIVPDGVGGYIERPAALALGD